MDFFGFNKVFRELEKASWRPTMFEDLQVCYCEEGLYALRCKHGTSNEHICLIREESEDAAIARAVFDLHKRGESEITVRTDNSAVIAELQRRIEKQTEISKEFVDENAALRAKLKVAENALEKLQDRLVSSVHDGTINPHEALKVAEDALAAIRKKGADNDNA